MWTEAKAAPGGRHQILKIIESSGLNVEYMYSLGRTIDDSAVMIFKFDKIGQAISALTREKLPVMGKDRVTGD